MLWIIFLGFFGSLAVLVSFCMTTTKTLRTIALASNVLFGLYGLLGHVYPILALHMILLPINLARLRQLHSRSSPRQPAIDSPTNSVGHCSNGLTTRTLKAATPAGHAIYRKWLRGGMVYYALLAIVFGLFVIVNHTKLGSESVVTAVSRSVLTAARTLSVQGCSIYTLSRCDSRGGDRRTWTGEHHDLKG
jgi:hypothetical protein